MRSLGIRLVHRNLFGLRFRPMLRPERRATSWMKSATIPDMTAPKIKKKPRMNSRAIVQGLLSGALFFSSFSAIAQGQRHTAANKANSKGTMLFSDNCAACHGTDGRGGERAPNIATSHEIVSLSNVQLSNIIGKGILSAGMPGFGYLGTEKIGDLVAHLRQLQGITNDRNVPLPGDPRVGQEIFFRTGACSSCHSIHGRGGFLSDDLTGYARGRSIASIEQAIAHPDTPGNSEDLVTVQTVDEGIITGAVRAQDNFNLVVQTEEGDYRNIARDRVESIQRSPRGIAIQNYGKSLTRKQMNDVVSYLIQVAGAGDSQPAVTKRTR